MPIRFSILGVLIALATGSLSVTPSWANEQRIVAVVNDDVISLQDLDDRLRLVVLTSGIPDDPSARSRLAPQVLRGLIEEKLQQQEAAGLSIAVSDEEVQQALANIAQRNDLSVEGMQDFLGQNDVNVDTLLTQLRAQIAWVKVVNREIRPQVTVTVDQLELAVQEASLSQGQPEFLLSEIVLPVDNPEQEDTVANDAGRIVQTVREGASFGALARQVSAAASGEKGGDLGWVRAAVIPPELLGALERLRPGDVSDPVRSTVGYHIFWLRERRTTEVSLDPTAGSVEVSLTQILFPPNGAALDELREQAATFRDRLVDCTAMVEVAEELEAPASGELGWIKIADLPTDLGQAVLSLPVGQVSSPLQGPGGIHLLMVCDRREPDQLNPEREKVAQRLEQERVERLARRYLRDLRKDAFVDVRL